MDASTAALLTFAGGALTFAAIVLQIIAPIWRGAEPGARRYFLAHTLNAVVLLVAVSAFAARFLWRSLLVSSLLFYLYIFLSSWQFTRAPVSPSRFEIVVYVFTTVFTTYMATSSGEQAASLLRATPKP